MTQVDPDPDAGLQPERTAFAWQRTFLAVAMVAALLSAAALAAGVAAVVALSAALTVAGVIVAVWLLRSRSLQVEPWWALVWTVAAVVVVALGAVVVGVVSLRTG